MTSGLMDAMSDDPNPWQRSQPDSDPWAPPHSPSGEQPPVPPRAAANPYATPPQAPPPQAPPPVFPSSASSAPYPPHPQGTYPPPSYPPPAHPQAPYAQQGGLPGPAGHQSQPQPYAPGAHPGGAGYGPAPEPPQSVNPLAGVFDFSFDSYATPVAAKVIFILAIVAFLGGWVGDVLSALQGYPAAGTSPLLTLAFGWVPALVWICLVRAGLEGVLALIRMHQQGERAVDGAGDSTDVGNSDAS